MKTFNHILKSRVEKESRLRWLDFFEKLLTADGSSLRPEYELDGTHLHPAYMKDFAQAINNAQ